MFTLATSVSTDTYGALLPPLDGRTNPQNQQYANFAAEVLRRDFPGQNMDDRWNQVERYRGAVYIAIRAIMNGMSGSTCKLLKRTPNPTAKSLKRKSFEANAESWSDEWEPLNPQHAVSQLFREVNPQQTFDAFLADYVMMLNLTGKSFVWAVPGQRTGKPSELWVIRTPYIQPIYNMATIEYPTGAWQVQLPWPMTFSLPQAGSIIIDNREIVLHRETHPRWWWDGMSPLTAGGLELDSLDQVNWARKNAMERGPTLDTMVAVEGATEAELKKLAVEWQGQFMNQMKGDRIAFTAGAGVTAENIGLAPKDMSFESGYEQLTQFALALFGVPHPIVSLVDSGSYAALYASLLQFNVNTLIPLAKKISEHLTKHLIAPYWGDDIKLVVELPSIQSPDDRRAEYAQDINIMTVNQRRKMRNMIPFGPEGDVPESIYLMKMQNELTLDMQKQTMEMQQEMQPQMQPGMEGQEQPQGEEQVPQEQPQMDGGGEVPPEQGNIGQSEDGEQPSEFQQKIIAEVLKSLDVNPDEVATQQKGFLLSSHEAACVMVDLTFEARRRIRDFGEMIAPEDLADKGIEDDPHVTVLYGIYDYAMRPGAWRSAVRKVIEKNPRFDITVGQPKAFRSVNTGKPYDVIYLEVHGPGLNRLNGELKEKVPVYSTYPNYTPHATIAYVQPGAADKYLQMFGQVKPLKHHCHEILFSDCFHNKTRIDLCKPSMKGIIKKSMHGDRLETFLKAGRIPNNPTPKPKKVAPTPVTPKPAAPVEPAKARSLSDLVPKAKDPKVQPRELDTSTPKTGSKDSTTGGKPRLEKPDRKVGGTAGGTPNATPAVPVGDSSAQKRDESSVVSAEQPKTTTPDIADMSHLLTHEATGAVGSRAAAPVDSAARMADGFENSRNKREVAKQADIDAKNASRPKAGTDATTVSSTQAADDASDSTANPNTTVDEQAKTQATANVDNPPSTKITDKTHQHFTTVGGWGDTPTKEDKPITRKNDLDAASGVNPELNTKTGPQSKPNELAPDDSMSDVKKQVTADDAANAYAEFSNNKTPEKKQAFLAKLGSLDERYHERFAAKVGLSPEEFKDLISKTPKPEKEAEVTDAQHSDSVANAAHQTVDKELADFKAKQQGQKQPEEPYWLVNIGSKGNAVKVPKSAAATPEAAYVAAGKGLGLNEKDSLKQGFSAREINPVQDNVKRDDKDLDAAFGVNPQPQTQSGASDFDRDLNAVNNNTKKKQSFGEFLKDNPELANNPREAAKAYKDAQDKANQPSFQEFVDANPDMSHDEVVDAYEQQHPQQANQQQQQQQPDPNDAGDLSDNIDIPPLEDEKAIPVAKQAKKKLGRPSVVDNLLGTASAHDISQLKSVNDWGKFITSAVVMGVARKHALGMFSAKSLILHVLGAYAFHLFNQASQDGKVETESNDAGELNPIEKPTQVAKPIPKPVNGSTSAIRNNQHFSNKRAQENYAENQIAQKRYNKDVVEAQANPAKPVGKDGKPVSKPKESAKPNHPIYDEVKPEEKKIDNPVYDIADDSFSDKDALNKTDKQFDDLSNHFFGKKFEELDKDQRRQVVETANEKKEDSGTYGLVDDKPKASVKKPVDKQAEKKPVEKVVPEKKKESPKPKPKTGPKESAFEPYKSLDQRKKEEKLKSDATIAAPTTPEPSGLGNNVDDDPESALNGGPESTIENEGTKNLGKLSIQDKLSNKTLDGIYTDDGVKMRLGLSDEEFEKAKSDGLITQNPDNDTYEITKGKPEVKTTVADKLNGKTGKIDHPVMKEDKPKIDHEVYKGKSEPEKKAEPEKKKDDVNSGIKKHLSSAPPEFKSKIESMLGSKDHDLMDVYHELYNDEGKSWMSKSPKDHEALQKEVLDRLKKENGYREMNIQVGKAIDQQDDEVRLTQNEDGRVIQGGIVEKIIRPGIVDKEGRTVSPAVVRNSNKSLTSYFDNLIEEVLSGN